MQDPIKLIEQANVYDAGAAALAMVLRLNSPAEAERVLGRECSADHSDRGINPPKMGVSGEEMMCALFRAGIPALPFIDIERVSPGAAELRVWDRLRICEWDFLQRHICVGRTAMIAVPSLSNTANTHWIVVSGGKMFDPARGEKYGSFSEVTRILGALLIGERPRTPTSSVNRLADWLRGCGFELRKHRGRISPIST